MFCSFHRKSTQKHTLKKKLLRGTARKQQNWDSGHLSSVVTLRLNHQEWAMGEGQPLLWAEMILSSTTCIRRLYLLPVLSRKYCNQAKKQFNSTLGPNMCYKILLWSKKIVILLRTEASSSRKHFRLTDLPRPPEDTTSALHARN